MSATYLLAFLKVALRGPDGAVVKEAAGNAAAARADRPQVPRCVCAVRYGKTHDEWVADNENQQPQKAKGKPYEGHESLTGYLLFYALRAGVTAARLLDDDGA